MQIHANSSSSLVTDIGKSIILPISVIRFSDIGNLKWFSEIGKSANFLISENRFTDISNSFRFSYIGKSVDFLTSEIRFTDIGNSTWILISDICTVNRISDLGKPLSDFGNLIYRYRKIIYSTISVNRTIYRYLKLLTEIGNSIFWYR